MYRYIHTYIHIYIHIYTYIHIYIYIERQTSDVNISYGVASTSMLLKITGLFCKRAP